MHVDCELVHVVDVLASDNVVFGHSCIDVYEPVVGNDDDTSCDTYTSV